MIFFGSAMSTSTSRQPFCVFCRHVESMSGARERAAHRGRETHLEDVDREGVEELVRDQDRELVLGCGRSAALAR